MGKQPKDHLTKGGAAATGGTADTDDLDLSLDDEDNDEDSGTGGNADDDEDNDEDSGSGSDMAKMVADAFKKQMPAIQNMFQSEMDRRINSALNKVKPKAKKDDDDVDESGDAGKPVVADVRGARIAFREYLPDSIKLLSQEERALANEFGQAQIKARALTGFEDEDEVGREVAESVADFLTRARRFYSGRTKRVLEKQGALVPKPAGGQQPGGGTPPPGLEASVEAARKKDRELFPERYTD